MFGIGVLKTFSIPIHGGKRKTQNQPNKFSTYSFNPIKLKLGNMIVHDMTAGSMVFYFFICMILAGK